jgi:amino acid adenylation domain-containing protein
MLIHEDLDAAAARFPGRIALSEPDESEMTYEELAVLSSSFAERLRGLGVVAGDRVGIVLRKSIDAVVSIFAILKAGAAYVPIDAQAPHARGALALADARVAAVITEARYAAALTAGVAGHGVHPHWIALHSLGGGAGIRGLLAQAPGPAALTPVVGMTDGALAYVLYTSGSTGRPKGVMVSHRAAQSWVRWASARFAPLAEDRFSSHAPFHFDLSTFDLFVALRCGAQVVLIDEALGKEPMRLAEFIAARRISIWYSAPSILSLLAQSGKLALHDFSALRWVLFAGEVFPIAHLRALTQLWGHCRYCNLYGPTETNVCTYHEVTLPIAPERVAPLPIGRVCENLAGKVVDAQGRPVACGQEGELLIAGPNLMEGYWALPEQNARAFEIAQDGTRWYRTGDLVVEDHMGELRFVGRRDRMVKRRGFRVELGEIEACLYRHGQVAEAAVVAISDEQAGVRIAAHLSTKTQRKISIIELKRFCSEHVPVYMIPDAFVFHATLPKTSTDKLDYQRLQEHR